MRFFQSKSFKTLGAVTAALVGLLVLVGLLAAANGAIRIPGMADPDTAADSHADPPPKSPASTDSIELVASAHAFDAIVTISGCDKTIPGAVMALARLDIPGLMLYGGSIRPGRFKGQEVTIQQVFEGVGELAASGAPTAQKVLEALADNRLYFDPAAHKVYFKDAAGALFDAKTGDSASAANLKKVRVNNGLRSAIEAVLGSMTLMAAEPEKRIAAAVADPGVVRVADSWEAHLPDAMVELLDNKNQAAFDELLVAGYRDKPAELAELRWRISDLVTRKRQARSKRYGVQQNHRASARARTRPARRSPPRRASARSPAPDCGRGRPKRRRARRPPFA